MIFHQFWWHFQWVNCPQFWWLQTPRHISSLCLSASGWLFVSLLARKVSQIEAGAPPTHPVQCSGPLSVGPSLFLPSQVRDQPWHNILWEPSEDYSDFPKQRKETKRKWSKHPESLWECLISTTMKIVVGCFSQQVATAACQPWSLLTKQDQLQTCNTTRL